MKRWHLVELEDLPWMPRVIRNGATDLLDWLFARLEMYRPVVGQLRETGGIPGIACWLAFVPAASGFALQGVPDSEWVEPETAAPRHLDRPQEDEGLAHTPTVRVVRGSVTWVAQIDRTRRGMILGPTVRDLRMVLRECERC